VQSTATGAEPAKRPIVYLDQLPNELWQIDATHWPLDDGSPCATDGVS